MQCSACSTELPGQARFCLSCGAPVTARCIGCGAELVPEARFCMSCGTARPDATGPTGVAAASRRTTSILFGDLVGFTTLSETRDTEDVRELLARYFEECRRIVDRYGGTIEKFIGDAVMAVWGVPLAHEDDAERAVRAGLELVTAVSEFGADVGAPDLALRVGVVTGEVAVTVGATHQGMVAGDAVNTAARVQSVAAPGQVWVDETTRLLTSAALTYADAGSHALKGKVDPVPLWSVRAVVAAVGGAQRADGLEAPLAGRERELRMVKELFHQCEESGRPLLLVVDGEAGVGKTRLGWEFEKYMDGLSRVVRWHRTRCVAYGEGVAFFALSEAVRGRLNAIAGTDLPDAQDAELLDAALEQLVPDLAEREWLRPRVAALLGLSSIGSYAREDLFASWVTFFERVGGGLQVALLVDDAQHADEGLLSFLEYVLAGGSIPFFLMLLTRPGLLEAHPSLATQRLANVVHLGPLRDPDMGALVDGLVAGLPVDVRDALVERSEGLPLFAVETVRALIDRDLVVPRGGQYVLAAPDGVDLASLAAPASLQALLASRLDALTPEQRVVVDRASVLGQSFTPKALEALCSEVSGLASVLADLVRLQILTRESSRLSSDYGQYSFVQAGIRQAAYGMLSRRDRKALHLGVVRHYEGQGDDGDDTAAIRAQHYLDALDAVPGAEDEARLREAAGDNLLQAAMRSATLGAPAEAARHLQAALSLAEEPERRARVLTLLATSLNDAGQYAEAREAGGAACRLYEELGDRPRAGRAAAQCALAMFLEGADDEASVAYLRPWWAELKERTDARAEALVVGRVMIRMMLWVMDWKGDTSEIHRTLEVTTRLAEAQHDLAGLIDCTHTLATYYAHARMFSVSTTLFEDALALAREHHRLEDAVRVAINLAATWNSRDLERGATLLPTLRDAARTGNANLTAFALTTVAAHAWASGSWDVLDDPVVARGPDAGPVDHVVLAALLAMRDEARRRPVTLDGWDEDPGDYAPQRAIRTLGRCVSLAASDRVQEALELGVALVREWADEVGIWDDGFLAWGWVARLAVATDDRDTVHRLLQSVRDQAPLPRAVEALVAQTTGVLAWRDGDPAAEDHLRRAVSLFEQWHATTYLAHARADLGRWCLDSGEREEGLLLLAQARATYDELGAEAWVAELDSAGRLT